MFRNPSPEALRALLQSARTIAVVGMSPKPARDSHRIAKRLMDWGYRVIPVRPAISEVLGQKAYPSLAEVPERIDLVDVFRNSADAGPVVEQCVALGLPAVWLQLGVYNEAAADKALAAGMTVVMDLCISVEYRRLVAQ